ncbi:DUF1801 domain-containing protein [Aquimarina intermedia]|uniref:Uncharacterized protein DUF1801 n=1 Tax=Aquimarina intermedia TaxID=350814 RepID=A0A5S5BWR4_9FLAO|nr:DUF1801 domain-containing protein [Aquimarina intermedia]TYP71615.1 uncharacterized protein DUF1801 [Aquimarina intermedia]
MEKVSMLSSSEVQTVIESYPAAFRERILILRKLIIETANVTEHVTVLVETLKWGEPSYVTKKGSTLRIGWNPKTPDYYGMYFHCASRLVPTFKRVYSDTFSFEGNRAIIFNLYDPIPEEELKACIRAALIYHMAKHLPTLGI